MLDSMISVFCVLSFNFTVWEDTINIPFLLIISIKQQLLFFEITQYNIQLSCLYSHIYTIKFFKSSGFFSKINTILH